jgi:hypothetical protein
VVIPGGRVAQTVGSKMNSLKNNDFICSINFRFLNEIKENSANCFDLLQFNKLF